MSGKAEYKQACLNIISKHSDWSNLRQAWWLYENSYNPIFRSVAHAEKRLKYYKGQDGRHNRRGLKTA